MYCLRSGSYFCAACRKQLHLDFPLSCVVCGKMRPAGVTCRDCRDATPLFGLAAVGSYHAAWLRRGIHWLKFKGVLPVAPILADFMAWRLVNVAPIDELRRHALLVPIPLHPRRLRQRGFNQSLELAKHLGEQLKIPVAELLIRKQATFAQAQLPAELRAANVSQAFELRQTMPRGKRLIFLVDDVATSGSTLEAAARALGTNKQHQIWGLTLARG